MNVTFSEFWSLGERGGGIQIKISISKKRKVLSKVNSQNFITDKQSDFSKQFFFN